MVCNNLHVWHYFTMSTPFSFYPFVPEDVGFKTVQECHVLINASRCGIDVVCVCANYTKTDLALPPLTHHNLESSAVVITSVIIVVVVVSVSAVVAMQAKEPDKQWDVTCSYCEVYNELIFDLLQDNSPPLDLRLPHCTHTILLTSHIMNPQGTDE